MGKENERGMKQPNDQDNVGQDPFKVCAEESDTIFAAVVGWPSDRFRTDGICDKILTAVVERIGDRLRRIVGEQ